MCARERVNAANTDAALRRRSAPLFLLTAVCPELPLLAGSYDDAPAPCNAKTERNQKEPPR